MRLFPSQRMLLGISEGDAFALRYEFAYPQRRDYALVDLTRYGTHPNPQYARPPGSYSDDTQMSIAVTEVLVGGKEFTRENLAESFVTCYKRDPIKGYAKGFQALLDSIDSGTAFLEQIRPDSIRNGAAMRSVPIGVIKDPKKVAEYAHINASVTHNTPKGIASSVAVALMSHHTLYHGSIYGHERSILSAASDHDLESAAYLDQVLHMKGFDATLLLGEAHKDKGVPCDGMRTAGAVLYLINNYHHPLEILRESVRLGGDTDSVASIALGINLIHKDIDDMPEFLYDNLTNHKYGRDYILDLGEKLEAFSRSQ